MMCCLWPWANNDTVENRERDVTKGVAIENKDKGQNAMNRQWVLGIVKCTKPS